MGSNLLEENDSLGGGGAVLSKKSHEHVKSRGW